jgi:hypothetical protein
VRNRSSPDLIRPSIHPLSCRRLSSFVPTLRHESFRFATGLGGLPPSLWLRRGHQTAARASGYPHSCRREIACRHRRRLVSLPLRAAPVLKARPVSCVCETSRTQLDTWPRCCCLRYNHTPRPFGPSLRRCPQVITTNMVQGEQTQSHVRSSSRLSARTDHGPSAQPRHGPVLVGLFGCLQPYLIVIMPGDRLKKVESSWATSLGPSNTEHLLRQPLRRSHEVAHCSQYERQRPFCDRWTTSPARRFS